MPRERLSCASIVTRVVAHVSLNAVARVFRLEPFAQPQGLAGPGLPGSKRDLVRGMLYDVRDALKVMRFTYKLVPGSLLVARDGFLAVNDTTPLGFTQSRMPICSGATLVALSYVHARENSNIAALNDDGHLCGSVFEAIVNDMQQRCVVRSMDFLKLEFL